MQMINEFNTGATMAPPAEPPDIMPRWGAVASLAVGTFATVTTEFLPIGLLPSIAKSLGVSEGQAGLMVTVPGVVAAFAGPTLIMAAGHLDRRRVLLMLSALLLVSNAIAALATTLPVMLGARFLLGLCVGGFWTFAPGATTYLVPAHLRARAMSLVLGGISVATVAGVPAGALLGNLLGWRAAFAGTGAIAALVLGLQLRGLPSTPSGTPVGIKDLLQAFRYPSVRVGVALTSVMAAGHFSAYTYLRPMLQTTFVQSASLVTASLLAYGLAGLIGTFVGEKLALKSVRATFALAAGLIAAVLLFSALLAGGPAAGVVVSIVWGAAFGLVPVSLTVWMLNALPRTPDVGQALLTCFFQIAISIGSAAGGWIFDGSGIAGALLLGSCCAGVGLILATVSKSPR